MERTEIVTGKRVVKQHAHRAVRTTEDRCYSGSVSRHPWTEENRAAHGGITYREICACGASRAVNQNGRHIEVGTWGLDPVER